MKRLAVFLLVLGMWTQYGWHLIPNDLELQGSLWNVSQQALLIVALLALMVMSSSASVMASCSLLIVYAAKVIACEALWLIAPLPQVAGEDACQTRFQVPLFYLGMAAGLFLLIELVKNRG